MRSFTPCQTLLCRECASVGRFRHSETTSSARTFGNVTTITSTTHTCDHTYCPTCKEDAKAYTADRKARSKSIWYWQRGVLLVTVIIVVLTTTLVTLHYIRSADDSMPSLAPPPSFAPTPPSFPPTRFPTFTPINDEPLSNDDTADDTVNDIISNGDPY